MIQQPVSFLVGFSPPNPLESGFSQLTILCCIPCAAVVQAPFCASLDKTPMVACTTIPVFAVKLSSVVLSVLPSIIHLIRTFGSPSAGTQRLFGCSAQLQSFLSRRSFHQQTPGGPTLQPGISRRQASSKQKILSEVFELFGSHKNARRPDDMATHKVLFETETSCEKHEIFHDSSVQHRIAFVMLTGRISGGWTTAHSDLLRWQLDVHVQDGL